MSCNCKTKQKILQIHKNYGYDIKASWKERTAFKIEETFKIILVVILCIILFPIIFLVIIFLILGGKSSFNINNILNFLLRKNKDE